MSAHPFPAKGKPVVDPPKQAPVTSGQVHPMKQEPSLKAHPKSVPVPSGQVGPMKLAPEPSGHVQPMKPLPAPSGQVQPMKPAPVPSGQVQPMKPAPGPSGQVQPMKPAPVPSGHVQPMKPASGPSDQVQPMKPAPVPSGQVQPMKLAPATSIQIQPMKLAPATSIQIQPMKSAPILGSSSSKMLNKPGQQAPSGGGITFQGLMPIFPPIKGVPKGLEALVGLDTIIIQEQIQLIEILLDFEMSTQYNILNKYGKRKYFAVEQSGCCKRKCCGTSRPFQILLLDGKGEVAVALDRECNCTLCWWGSNVAGTDVLVRSGFTSEIYGRVAQNFNCCSPRYSIFDGNGVQMLTVEGPRIRTGCTSCVMCYDAPQFHVYLSEQMAKSMKISPIQPMEGTPIRQGQILVGTILKNFTSVEFVSDSNQFGIHFSRNLDPRITATLIGATMAIDFSFFETGVYGTRRDCSTCNCVIILIVVLVVVVLSASR